LEITVTDSNDLVSEDICTALEEFEKFLAGNPQLKKIDEHDYGPYRVVVFQAEDGTRVRKWLRK
jgi:hypothetical protein